MADNVSKPAARPVRQGFSKSVNKSQGKYSGAPKPRTASKPKPITAEDVRLRRVAEVERPLTLFEQAKLMQVPYCDFRTRQALDKYVAQQKQAGKMPAAMTTDVLVAVNDRMKNPRKSTVVKPADMRTERELKLEQADFDGMSARRDDRVYEKILAARDRDIRWSYEKPEYERRLKEAEKINDICEAAVKDLTAAPDVKAKLPQGRLQQAHQQLYEIAITGHLKGVSEDLLGSQENTCKNYEYHFKRKNMAPESGCEYLQLKHFEYLRTHPGIERQMAQERMQQKFTGRGPSTQDVLQKKSAPGSVRAAQDALQQKSAQNFMQAAQSILQQKSGQNVAQQKQQPQSVYTGEAGVPIDINHPNRTRIVDVSRDTSDLKVSAAFAASQDMSQNYGE